MATLLIVDDHEIIRKGIKSVVSAHPEVDDIHEASNGSDAYQLMNNQVFDLIILDINLPGISGIETLRKILQKYPSQKILMLSMHENPAIIHQAMTAGAMGFIGKGEFAENLNDAVKTIFSGKVFISQELSDAVQSSQSNKTNLNILTTREFEVLKLLASGKTNSEVAKLLSISPKTVANKLALIKEKMEISSDFELFHAAKENNLI